MDPLPSTERNRYEGCSHILLNGNKPVQVETTIVALSEEYYSLGKILSCIWEFPLDSNDLALWAFVNSKSRAPVFNNEAGSIYRWCCTYRETSTILVIAKITLCELKEIQEGHWRVSFEDIREGQAFLQANLGRSCR
ncbi:hypothetical protein TWF788_006166 [Orbilia oligospora]|uniref:Uncharacterized protein n=1 Tax=Orbilia oligospora TaxID=2813651 RepID=A0A7C8U1T4_ORBOL|nr:hypothetical protein TWF788_006166 [Orbilia oligospora]